MADSSPYFAAIASAAPAVGIAVTIGLDRLTDACFPLPRTGVRPVVTLSVLIVTALLCAALPAGLLALALERLAEKGSVSGWAVPWINWGLAYLLAVVAILLPWWVHFVQRMVDPASWVEESKPYPQLSDPSEEARLMVGGEPLDSDGTDRKSKNKRRRKRKR